MSDDEEAGAGIKRRALGNVNTLSGNISAVGGTGSGKRRRNDAPQWYHDNIYNCCASYKNFKSCVLSVFQTLAVFLDLPCSPL
jgi:hypothetical protein